MTTTSPSPSGPVLEVFRYFASTSHTVGDASANAYGDFRSSFYVFRSPTRASAATSRAASATTDAKQHAPAPTESVVAEHDKSVPALSAPRALHAAPRVLTRYDDAPTAAAEQSSRRASLQCAIPSPPHAPASRAAPSSQPPAPTSSSTGNAMQRTIPASLSPTQMSARRVSAAVIDDVESVGSIELPVEQQPDDEFVSPRSRQLIASGSTGAIVSSPVSFQTGPVVERSREVDPFDRAAHRAVEHSREVVETTVSTPSQSDSFEAEGHVPQRVSVANVPTRKMMCGSPLTTLGERRASPVFTTTGSFKNMSGVRRVSLRRPVFDEDD